MIVADDRAVSIVIPCYNREKEIVRAVESVRAQKHRPLEIVVVDDGSDDGSWDVIQGLGADLISRRIANSGPSAARNVGIGLSSSRYIKFLDSDDALSPEALGEQIDTAMGQSEKSISVFSGSMQWPDGRKVAAEPFSGRSRRPGVLDFEELVSGSIQVSLPLYPRNALERAGGFRSDLRIFEDYDLNMRLAIAGYQFIFENTVSSVLHQHSGSRLTTGPSRSAFAGLSRAFDDNWVALEAAEGGAETGAVRRAFGRLIWRVARRAARAGYVDVADDLFSLARRRVGRAARVGSPGILAMYELMSPVDVEFVVELAKGRLIRRHM